MARRVPLLAGCLSRAAGLRFGLAVLENAYDQPYRILAVPADRILADEPALLEEAKAAMPRVPFDQLDVLRSTGSARTSRATAPTRTSPAATRPPFASGGPDVAKQVVLSLTGETEGNANGIGTADFTTVRAVEQTDLGQTYPNGLTSTVVGPTALPMILPSDRLALAAAVLTCNAVGRAPRVLRIADTLALREFLVSDALLDEVAAHPHLAYHLRAERSPV